MKYHENQNPKDYEQALIFEIFVKPILTIPDQIEKYGSQETIHLALKHVLELRKNQIKESISSDQNFLDHNYLDINVNYFIELGLNPSQLIGLLNLIMQINVTSTKKDADDGINVIQQSVFSKMEYKTKQDVIESQHEKYLNVNRVRLYYSEIGKLAPETVWHSSFFDHSVLDAVYEQVQMIQELDEFLSEEHQIQHMTKEEMSELEDYLNTMSKKEE